MAHYYQNVLTGEQVEVKTLDEDDYYAENKANWARIASPPPAPSAYAGMKAGELREAGKALDPPIVFPVGTTKAEMIERLEAE